MWSFYHSRLNSAKLFARRRRLLKKTAKPSARQGKASRGSSRQKKARRPSYIYGWLEKIIIFLSAYNFLFGKNSSAGKKRELVTQDDIFLLHPTLFYHFPLFVLVLSSKFVVFRFFVWQKQPELTSFLFSFLCEKRMRQEMFGSRKKRRRKNELEQLYIKINIHLKPSEKRTPSNERTNKLRLLFSHLAPHRKTNRKQTSKREEAKRLSIAAIYLSRSRSGRRSFFLLSFYLFFLLSSQL